MPGNRKFLLFLLLIICSLISFWLGQYETRQDIWTGFYYPDIERIEDQRTWILSPPLYSLNECREWVSAIHRQNDRNYDYSCGRGCYFIKKYESETIICKADSK